MILTILKGADINAITNDGETAMMQSAQRDDIKILTFLISKKADLNLQMFGNGWTALIFATYSDHKNTVKILLDAGAKVDQLSKESYTALVYAAKVNSNYFVLLKKMNPDRYFSCSKKYQLTLNLVWIVFFFKLRKEL